MSDSRSFSAAGTAHGQRLVGDASRLAGGGGVLSRVDLGVAGLLTFSA